MRVPSKAKPTPMRVPGTGADIPPAFLAMAAAHMQTLGRLAPPNGTGQPVLPDPSQAAPDGN